MDPFSRSVGPLRVNRKPILLRADLSQKVPASLYNKLMNLDLEAFTKVLESSTTKDVNYQFGQTLETLVLMCCRHQHYVKFLEKLLSHGADPNITNARQQAPIHVATFFSNDDALLLLLNDKRTFVNALDKNGCTALHYAAEPTWRLHSSQKHTACICLLFGNPDFKPNRPDTTGLTPLATAVLLYFEDRVKTFFEEGGHKLNVDCSRGPGGLGIRMIIKARFPDLADSLPQPKFEMLDDPDIYKRAIAALQNDELDTFISCVKNMDVEHVYDDPYYSTLLEITCRTADRRAFVKAVLKYGADPNTVNAIYGLPVIHQAAELANYGALKVLVKDDRTWLRAVDQMENSVLHALARRSCQTEEEIEMLNKCIRLLLKRTLDYELNIDTANVYGDTALMYAARCGNVYVVQALLRYGADIITRNADGESPLEFITRAVMKTFLDEQVMSNGISPHHEDFQIIIDYDFMDNTPFTIGTRLRNSDFFLLQYMSQSVELMPLLKHPVIKTFLSLKWYYYRLIFYAKIIIQAIFIITLLQYFFFTMDCLPEHSLSILDACPDVYVIWAVECILLVTLVLLVVDCFMDLLATSRAILYELEVYIFLVMILSTLFVMYVRIDVWTRQQAFAVANLTAWASLIMQIGRLPVMAEHLAILRKVSASFFGFLSWSWMLWLAFMLSFYVLMNNVSASGFHSWDFLPTATKVMAMFVNEFNLSYFPMEDVRFTAHLLIVLYCVFVSILLLNLLSGIAVSDTQAIRKDAQVLALRSLIASVFLSEWKLLKVMALFRVCTAKRRHPRAPRMSLFESGTHKKQIHVFGHTRKVKFLLDVDKTKKFRKFRLDKKIIEGAIIILKKGNHL